MTTLILLLKLFFISWVITRFEPLHMVLDILPDKMLLNLTRLLLTCIKCVSFWLTLIITTDILLASAMAFSSFWYDKLVSPLENKVRL